MSEKPILFSTSMVRAILDGRKTMTRRVVKSHIVDNFIFGPGGILLGSYREGSIDAYPTIDDAPYQPGDHLWVKETWAFIDNLNAGVGNDQYYEYKADTNNPLPGGWPIEAKEATTLRWKSPRFMPKVAARIWLEVTDVRAERLQEITEEDARAEGVYPGFQIAGPNSTPATTGKQAFMWLWQSLNDKRGFPWAHNPWVWVISFERRTV